jgi:ubiquinone/menaquinone biosynthesis C-methylase UbiE
VLIFDVLEHVEDVDGTLQEIYRVLKPQGLLYCFVPCEGDWLSLWHLLEKLHLKRNLTQRYAGHINYFSRRELRNQLQKHRLELVSARYGEHVLGQLLGVISFTLMHRTAQKKQLSQLNNETYFVEKTEQSGGWYQVVKNVINSLIYLESLVGSRIPSPNVHYVVRKQV